MAGRIRIRMDGFVQCAGAGEDLQSDEQEKAGERPHPAGALASTGKRFICHFHCVCNKSHCEPGCARIFSKEIEFEEVVEKEMQAAALALVY